MLKLDTDQHGQPQFVRLMDDTGQSLAIPAAHARAALLHAARADQHIAVQRAIIRTLCRRNAELVMQARVVARAYQQQQARLEWIDKQLARAQALDPAAPWRAKEVAK